MGERGSGGAGDRREGMTGQNAAISIPLCYI